MSREVLELVVLFGILVVVTFVMGSVQGWYWLNAGRRKGGRK